MKVVIEVQTDCCNGEFLDSHEETIEVFACHGKVFVERPESEQLIIPLEVFKGLGVMK